MRLLCHEDTWAALQALPSALVHTPDHRRIEATEERITARENGMLEIVLSGPQIVRILQVTSHNSKNGSPEEQAIAERTYIGFGSVLDTVGSHHSTEEIPPVILDDRPQAPA
ncbi:hypothetical protein GCM10023222_58770 [Saccharopolyspora cebuensis]